ncbi:MAG TPA: PIN domain-containing protein [Kofleriaceae bacterium]|nr:PIN domain-containing protein [Kofleriaceae bacterium]
MVVDACALVPVSLCDALLRAASAGLFQIYWSEEILEETRRNLVAKVGLTGDQAAHRCNAMRKYFREAMVTGYEPHVGSMANEPKDRHVAAAALKAGAQVIVTSNLRDFKNLPEGIEAQTPDEFLCNLFDLDPGTMVALVRAQAAALKRPPVTFEHLLGGLATVVPDFAAAIKGHSSPEEE